MTEIIDVCICTFRRDSLQATLASLAEQVLAEGVQLRVIVADNDDMPARRPGIEAAGAAFGLQLVYVHAPARNISVARNACLDAARADWLVFIDDDEVAAPGWIMALLRRRQGHDIVFGVSQARYPHPGTPAWVTEGDFHSNRIAGNDPPWNGYTANVLLDRRMIAASGLRFQPALGQTGGEDTMFFFDAQRAGARFGYAPDAIVTEDTPVERAGWQWLARRRFRSGQVHYLLLRRGGAGRFAGIAAAPKAIACFAQALVALPSRRRTAAAALRGMLHVGVLASMAGYAPYREYAEPSVG
ncbi:glycosyl transferase family A [Polymorphobacter multimanifer]|uniref:Succinoglycan biosynthesis protein ExoM n=1 Tax=Polymorphobacter multimanifer TaxID=1070431 RepID=A0A841L185_9SPHN|nr:glycosyltransferase [Polymorphobacter multimanifer]MBB6226437.1 succinoglycan biosynthesis protein ExoM [Polymorphobacter multimanifer]GGI67604.1 glycosyl transferase family A [Polymorphobacter multimanifer]